MEAKRRALDEIAARQCAADTKRKAKRSLKRNSIPLHSKILGPLRFAFAGMTAFGSRFLGASSFFRPALFILVEAWNRP
jgi:hypothetical protein